jgi:hypothetical protein
MASPPERSGRLNNRLIWLWLHIKGIRVNESPAQILRWAFGARYRSNIVTYSVIFHKINDCKDVGISA